jgi:cell division protein FtsZ
MKEKIMKPTSIIKVIGVGGGGSNAVNHMYKQGIVGVDFAICNTDGQALDMSNVPEKLQLGPDLTEGRGAGSKPNIGREACVESIENVREFFEDNTKMLFVTAGMGGGTGTGAAPVIAKAAQELDILTVGIVTMPFMFEGRLRMQHALEGLEELKKNVDTIIVISNDKLRQMHGNLTMSQAFAEADNVLATAARGIAEIITVPGYINVDFEDVNTVMRGSGVAIMGTSTAEGKDRARRAAETALRSPLLEDNNIQGAQHILLNITSGKNEVTMDEVWEITSFIQDEAGNDTNLIWGNCYDPSLNDELIVTVIATGFERKNIGLRPGAQATKQPKSNEPKIVVQLDDDAPAKTPKYDPYSGGNAPTFEFDAPQPPKKEPTKTSYDEPYVKEQPTPDPQRQTWEERRRQRLHDLSVRLNNPQSINEIENQPAYMRKQVNLDDVPPSSEKQMSRYSLGEDDRPELRENNSFLHDNID